MTAHQNFAFQQLLAAWRRREDARASGSTIAELGAARIDLEHARGAMHHSMR